MSYFLTIISGPDEGKSCEVVGDCVVGRAGDAGLQVEDESVSWEHAIVREHDDRLVLENLSALGTNVNGKAVTGEVKLGHGDEVELSPRCSFRVESRLTAGSRRTSPVLIIAGIGVVVLVGILGVFWAAQQAAARMPARAESAPTPAQWRAAYTRIDQRLQRWEESDDVPEYLVHAFRDAWRIDQSELDREAAHRMWTSLWSTLISEPVPGSNKPLGAEQPEDPTALMVLMGRKAGEDPSLPQWSTDESYAHALIWFVRGRVMLTQPKKK